MSERATKQLAIFVLVAFGWTWTWDAVYYGFGWWETLPTTLPRQWGVPLGAIAAVRASDTSLRAWLSGIFAWRLHPGLYLVAILVPLTITNVRPVLRALGGGNLSYSPPASLPLIVLFVLANALILGGIEEIGWRGFLQPRLQERVSVVTAGIVVGVLWWAWHLPLFLGHRNFVLEPVPVLRYTVFVIGASTVFGAFVNGTNGSILPLMLMHAGTNLGPVLSGSGGMGSGSTMLPLVVGSGLWWLIVLVLVLVYGRSMVPNETLDRRKTRL
ncbi:CPBP family intramembrane glutamic endopeptidase [Natrinema halophilum]|uniref:CPBP family intramembrane metalloprotease n=1 Tax=Natrinema halophilum TaxID=1699371 RepID=A0A7D5L3G0_9EURY|nr:type II CAAX endopeptidase family protein [Natrinema halophilum]QLG49645.1 CPBP family intramembrane metalloprotease [Natrinema halophilum]